MSVALECDAGGDGDEETLAQFSKVRSRVKISMGIEFWREYLTEFHSITWTEHLLNFTQLLCKTSHAEAMRDAYGPYASIFDVGGAANPGTLQVTSE